MKTKETEQDEIIKEVLRREGYTDLKSALMDCSRQKLTLIVHQFMSGYSDQQTASLQSDLLSLNSNLLTMADNVDLAFKERDRYKEALDGVTNLIQKEIWTCKQEIAINVDPQINAEWANAYNYLLTKLTPQP